MSPKFVKNPFEDDQLVDVEGQEVEQPEEAANEEPLFTEIDHVAIAVNDLPAAIDFYRESFGAIVEHREIVDSDGVEEALLKVADSYIQLLTPTHDDSPVAKYLEKKGEGLHHV